MRRYLGVDVFARCRAASMPETSRAEDVPLTA
jgi:hypothetical protein